MIEIIKIGFLSFSLIDIIDVSLIAILVLWLYKSLKDTIAVQILLGLIVLIGLSFITEAVNLKSLNWIIKTVLNIWLLGFIILFQPEIRRLLLKITRQSLFRVLIKPQQIKTIETICEAAIELSSKHIGALIVFTRSQNVEMTVDTGITLHALITKELLISIFNTKAPLHDGAVIVDNHSIIAARCVLPLTSMTKYSGENLGTRHRAALGLTEQLDAVVLVVSEETGGISIAEGGEIMLRIPKNKLYEELNNRLTKK